MCFFFLYLILLLFLYSNQENWLLLKTFLLAWQSRFSPEGCPATLCTAILETNTRKIHLFSYNVMGKHAFWTASFQCLAKNLMAVFSEITYLNARRLSWFYNAAFCSLLHHCACIFFNLTLIWGRQQRVLIFCIEVNYHHLLSSSG